MSSGKTSLVPFTGFRSSFSEAALDAPPPPTRLSASWSTAALALPPPDGAGGAVEKQSNTGQHALCVEVLWCHLIVVSLYVVVDARDVYGIF